MTNDSELLVRYFEDKSEAAFTELVRRHIDFVYGTALRQSGNAHQAQDIVQHVFHDVARKAKRLSDHPEFVGWLYTCTRYHSKHYVRAEWRRRKREGAVMQSDALTNEPAVEWTQLQPFLDDSLSSLGDRDRSALLLRFFKGYSFAEIGTAVGLSEDGARRRVERALDK